MLFTSFEFIFAYLPVVFVGFFLLGRLHRGAAAAWLAAASVFFYGYWSARHVPVLLGSILVNYGVGYAIVTWRDRSPWAKRALVAGIVANLALLVYYKYYNFFMQDIVRPLGGHPRLLEIILPIGISFFTFTQIAYLVDTWRGLVRERNFIHYLLFVTWFPHLIAGPVLHHGQMMPQFRDPAIYGPRSRNLSVGAVLFTIGIAKKLLIADPISAYVDPVFSAAAAGTPLGMTAAWVGALAYTFQIYFDFSGYSDMAVGLSMLFGIRLPINFSSPYKAASIVEFWRRWHITLSHFLRDYLYIPLGGNRKGGARRYVNLLATMVLGGLWHGANWTFVVWGALHGAYLCGNHAWQWVARRAGVAGRLPRAFTVPASIVLTFLLVVAAWVYFRAETVTAANAILVAMAAGTNEVAWSAVFGVHGALTFTMYAVVASVIVWVFPNAYEIIDLMERHIEVQGAEGYRITAMLCVGAATLGVFLLGASLISAFGTKINSPFLYFQF